MADSGLSEALRQLVNRHLLTMDHVALLLALREQPEIAHTPASLAERVRLERAVADSVLHDLVTAQLARPEGDAFIYAPAPQVRPTVDELAEMNRTRPVTLVRAIYDRPSRAALSFADAFRLRKPGQ
jgi:CRP-like cAMP-binding protein